ncbi:hypothetical protein ACFQ69_26080 [Streptomyces sp. NPDC056470]|uniref:hypothetical protein n=1 Tax=unclassified Streptomyces TaxID=2593676 RepID=UPI0036C42934
MPQAVKSLRVLMMVLGGMQAVLGVALLTNSVAIANSIWGEEETLLQDRGGIVVFAGVLVCAVAAWGIGTALKFPTRHPNVRISAAVYGWTALPFAYPFYGVMPILGVLWLVPAILAVVRPNQPETRAWFR